MKLVIQGTAYDVTEAMSKPTLNDLFMLKVQTRTADRPKGLSLKVLGEGMKAIGEFTDPSEFLEDDLSLQCLRALIFLCRRAAGEKVNLEQANDFPLSELGFESDDTDEELLAKEGPTRALPDSGQGDEPVTDQTVKSPTT